MHTPATVKAVKANAEILCVQSSFSTEDVLSAQLGESTVRPGAGQAREKVCVWFTGRQEEEKSITDLCNLQSQW